MTSFVGGADATTPSGIDAILDRLESAAKQVETSNDSQVVPKAEKDLLKYLADLQTSIDALLQKLDNDDLASLQGVFGGDCSRSGRTRAILEGLRFEDGSEWAVSKAQCMTALTSVEKILISTGSEEQLKKAQEREKKALFERIRRELQLEADEDEDDKMSEVWDDHPGNNQLPQIQTLSLPTPSDLSGHLWKKSPSPLVPIRQWKWRWVVLSAGKLQWFTSEAEAKKGDRKSLRGEIDFSLNPCTVGAVSNHTTQMSIRPHDGKWVMGAFTGSEKGREFLFDTFSSQWDQQTWVDAITTHLKHGGQAYGGTRLSFMGQ